MQKTTALGMQPFRSLRPISQPSLSDRFSTLRKVGNDLTKYKERIMTTEPKRDGHKYLLTERQFWILTAVLAVVIVLITRKLLAN